MKSKVLIVAAHPDDEILGCGGTVAKFIQQGAEVKTLILGEGKTARDEKRDAGNREEDIDALRKEAMDANKVLGVKDVILEDFPDNRFDEVAILDIVKVVEKVKNNFKPTIIFTHYENDLNVDHQVTYQAVITATRPLEGESVKEIYSFENMSSTEWKFPLSFSPDVFFDITDTMKVKLEALEKYRSEMREFPHPRSLKGVELVAQTWGMKLGCQYIESFKCVRVLRT